MKATPFWLHALAELIEQGRIILYVLKKLNDRLLETNNYSFLFLFDVMFNVVFCSPDKKGSNARPK